MSQTGKITLSERQKRLVRESFESLSEYQSSVLMLFYGRLFEIAPETRPLFHIDIREQSNKLMNTLATLIDALDRLELQMPHLAELGSKHVTYGVQPYHYEKLRSALLWALGHALGAEFGRETRTAWETLLAAVSAAMLDGAATAASPHNPAK